MNQNPQLKPQDVLVALKLHLLRGKPRPRLVDLGMELGLSQAEISGCLKRAAFAGLSSPETGMPFPSALREFVLHGLRYAFPAMPGPVARGIPTSHSAAPLNQTIVANESYVWPDADGQLRGPSIEPLYPSAPFAAKKDPQLHELLALIDALRVGQARERKLASEELQRRLS